VTALLTIALLGTALPALAQQEQVPQSLWGVRGDVGLGVVPQFVTNYGDRSALEERPSGEGIRVAVIDTGIAPDHPDLDSSLACDHCWRDFVDNRSQPYDDNGHGTHVAGIIAGNGHLQANPLNSYFPTGALGIASGSELIVAKAMNETGGGKDERVARAIDWSLDPDGEPGSGDEPHILHLSLGVRSPTTQDGKVVTGSETEAAVREAVERGVFVVMSAGNQGQRGPAVPGNVDGVVAVGALTSNGEVLEMSNRGEGVDVFAPGVVMSAWPRDLDRDRIDDGYTGLAGTSQAAPVVTGGLALAVDANPRLLEDSATKVEHVESMLQQTGDKRTTAGGTSVVTFDGERFLASQDQGTEELHWGLVGALALLLIAVVVTLGRVVYGLVEGPAEESSSPGGYRDGPERSAGRPSALESDESNAGGDAEFTDGSDAGR
jgi:subtilisin family serine protease